MDVLTRSSHDTARMETHEVVAYLLERLGRTLTAYIANTRSRAMPARWAAPPGEPSHATPADDKATRLKAAHTVFQAIEDADNDQIARSWLISANPRLGGHTPSDCIRDGKYKDVFNAAEAFISDHHYG